MSYFIQSIKKTKSGIQIKTNNDVSKSSVEFKKLPEELAEHIANLSAKVREVFFGIADDTVAKLTEISIKDIEGWHPEVIFKFSVADVTRGLLGQGGEITTGSIRIGERVFDNVLLDVDAAAKTPDFPLERRADISTLWDEIAETHLPQLDQFIEENYLALIEGERSQMEIEFGGL